MYYSCILYLIGVMLSWCKYFGASMEVGSGKMGGGKIGGEDGE